MLSCNFCVFVRENSLFFPSLTMFPIPRVSSFLCFELKKSILVLQVLRIGLGFCVQIDFSTLSAAPFQSMAILFTFDRRCLLKKKLLLYLFDVCIKIHKINLFFIIVLPLLTAACCIYGIIKVIIMKFRNLKFFSFPKFVTSVKCESIFWDVNFVVEMRTKKGGN